MPSAGKHATIAKRRKHATNAKGGKTCNRCSSAGKHATAAKSGKTRVSQVPIGFGFAPDWLNKQSAYSDWPEHVTTCFESVNLFLSSATFDNRTSMSNLFFLFVLGLISRLVLSDEIFVTQLAKYVTNSKVKQYVTIKLVGTTKFGTKPSFSPLLYVKASTMFVCLLFQAEPFLASLVSADNPITLLSDVIAILSHVARSSSEYVAMVTRVLQGDRGEKTSNRKVPSLLRSSF